MKILPRLKIEPREKGAFSAAVACGHLARSVLFVSCGIILLFGGTHTIEAQTPSYSRTPVLFVHGSGLSSTTWNRMINEFINLGYPPEYLYAIDLVPTGGANVPAAGFFISPAAELLLVQANNAAKDAGYTGPPHQRLDLIGHSMGAVSSRWYTAKLRPDRVRAWISLAGANHGTNTLCDYPTTDGNIEMCPAFATSSTQNAVQVDLNGTPTAPLDETPYGIGADPAGINRVSPDNVRRIVYYSIRIEPDFWIKPETSALVAGAGGVPLSIPSDLPLTETGAGNYLFTGETDHDNLPSHPDMIRFVALLLSNDLLVSAKEFQEEKYRPRTFSFSTNFPNPFHEGTRLQYHIPAAVRVVIKIYSLAGYEIRTLVRQEQEPGSYNVHWDGKNDGGITVPTGEYFCTMQAGDLVRTQKVIFIRP